MADFVAGEPIAVANGSSRTFEKYLDLNSTDGRKNGQSGRRGSDTSSERSAGSGLVLRDGGRLREESRTDSLAVNGNDNHGFW